MANNDAKPVKVYNLKTGKVEVLLLTENQIIDIKYGSLVSTYKLIN